MGDEYPTRPQGFYSAWYWAQSPDKIPVADVVAVTGIKFWVAEVLACVVAYRKTTSLAPSTNILGGYVAMLYNITPLCLSTCMLWTIIR